MGRLIKAELFKLRKRAMTSILLYVLIGLLIIMYLVLLAISNANLPNRHDAGGAIQNLLGLPEAIPFAFMMLGFVGTILACILAASSVGNEYNWRTIRTMLISSESRTKLLGAKLIAVSVYVLLGMVIGLAVGFIMSLITTAIGGYSFDFSFATGTYWWDQFVQLWRTFFIMLPYILLAFLLSVAGRSAMPGIAVSLGLFFLEPILIDPLMAMAGGWVAQIPDYLILKNFQVINALNGLPGGLGGLSGGTAAELSVTHAAVTLGIYMVVSLIIAFYLFRKRDVTS